LTVTGLTLANHNDTYKAVVGNANGTVVSNPAVLTVRAPLSRAQMLVIGDSLVMMNCTGCHGSELRGQAGGVPPLAYSDYFMADRRNIIRTLLTGRDDSIFVNGLSYQGSMPGWDWLSDSDIASILTYIRVVHNDSLVTTCNSNNLDPDGFATCAKTARSPSVIASDSIAVSEVKAIRDSLSAAASAKKGFRHY
jgi:mono/diheme cytochrome c family protein